MSIRVAFVFLLVFVSLNLSAEDKKNAGSVTASLKSLGLEVYSPDTPAPDIIITDTKGATYKLSDMKGKVLFVNFWASWCPPCKAEMPSIQKLNNAMKNKNFIIAAIDVGEPKEN